MFARIFGWWTARRKMTILGEKSMVKRMADWFANVSVAAIAVGLFQGQFVWGLTVAFAALAISLVLTRKLGGNSQ